MNIEEIASNVSDFLGLETRVVIEGAKMLFGPPNTRGLTEEQKEKLLIYFFEQKENNPGSIALGRTKNLALKWRLENARNG